MERTTPDTKPKKKFQRKNFHQEGARCGTGDRTLPANKLNLRASHQFRRAPLLRRKRLRVPPMLGGKGFCY